MRTKSTQEWLKLFASEGTALAVHGPLADGTYSLIPHDQWGEVEPNCADIPVAEVVRSKSKRKGG